MNPSCVQALHSPCQLEERERTIAMFSAMECAALLLLNPCAKVALAGSLAPVIGPEVGRLLGPAGYGVR